MGSVDPSAPAGIKLPTIKLDTTLAELYKRANPKNAGVRLGLVSCGVTSGLDLTPDFPRNTRFPYQDQPLNTEPRQELTVGNADLRKSLAKKYLSLIPQRDAFISGPMPVIFFNLDQTPQQIERDRREAEATISVLDPSQRPDLVFCLGPSMIPLQDHGIDKLDFKVALDGLQGYPLTHDLETHWFLNSKAALARSGLPTPRAEIIEPEGSCPDAESCCPACTSAATTPSELPSIPPTCTGPRRQWLSAQTNRVLSAVRSRPIPFVFKTQQAFGGAGTWVVTSPEQKSQLLADLFCSSSNGNNNKDDNDGVLPKLLTQVTRSNRHLGPATVLICDLVGGGGGGDAGKVVGDYGLTFVVTDGGRAEFLAAAEQTTDGSSAWIGSSICYPRQEELRRKFEGLMRRTAEWVGRFGYFGPVGVDVLEAETPAAAAAGKGGTECFIVDLNVRTCGSVSLPLLRSHFVGRGLECASSFSIVVKGGRAEFIRRWQGPFEEGRMLILSWYEDPEAGESIADVVVGGEDEGRLQELVRLVREDTEEVTF
ncbi:Putative solid-state culture specific ATP-grasp domain-containing protein [Madurella fahalii]|uniref:Solid-state culture specific ATP-grasp domain-containing protein n=1 Tax=Madurella fahalii TaxID=1157608 RepID=A0ABQ0G3X5_9PEZI